MRFLVIFIITLSLFADDSQQLLRIDHSVRVKSTVPAMNGQHAQIYVREAVLAGQALRSGDARPDRVVLFVHGAGTPASVAYDVLHSDYSWMAHLARNGGYDVFAMDHTGYGRSTRPAPMDDPCNLSPEYFRVLGRAPCEPTYKFTLTSMASDWNDIDAVVDYLRALRHVDKVTLIGWSLGGPRAGGYTAAHPEKVQRLILLSPAYNRNAAATAPQLPAPGSAMEVRSQATFMENWERQVGCPAQIDPAVAGQVWKQLQDSDPVAATWGPGLRRAPLVTNFGWNQAAAVKVQVPALLIAPIHDKQVAPAMVRNLFADLGSKQKVLIDLACTSHNALWEKNHLLLFDASLEWLQKGSVGGGKQEGEVRLGY